MCLIFKKNDETEMEGKREKKKKKKLRFRFFKQNIRWKEKKNELEQEDIPFYSHVLRGLLCYNTL